MSLCPAQILFVYIWYGSIPNAGWSFSSIFQLFLSVGSQFKNRHFINLCVGICALHWASRYLTDVHLGAIVIFFGACQYIQDHQYIWRSYRHIWESVMTFGAAGKSRVSISKSRWQLAHLGVIGISGVCKDYLT